MTSTLQASYNEVALVNSRLRQEVDRLRVRNVELEAMVQAARAEIAAAADRELALVEMVGAITKIERLRKSLPPMQIIADQETKLNEVAAFLDGLAERLEAWRPALTENAADCRAEARELRVEIERLIDVSETQHEAFKLLQAKLHDAATFLDRAALDLHGTGWVVLADEMRAMAKKLMRGET